MKKVTKEWKMELLERRLRKKMGARDNKYSAAAGSVSKVLAASEKKKREQKKGKENRIKDAMKKIGGPISDKDRK